MDLRLRQHNDCSRLRTLILTILQLKKGMTTKEPSKIYATGNKRKKNGDVAGAIRGAAAGTPATPKPTTPTRRTGKGKGKKIKKEESDDDSEDMEDLYDSDEDYGAPKKKSKKAKQTGVKKENGAVSPKTENGDGDGEAVKEEDDTGSPGMSTRGRRLNYARMQEGASDDEAVDGEEADAEEEEKDDTLTQSAPAAEVVNGLPTPDTNVEEAATPSTPSRAADLTGQAQMPSPQAYYTAPATPARPRYGLGSGSMDAYGGNGSQRVSIPSLSIVLTSSLTCLQYPAHYGYTNNYNTHYPSQFTHPSFYGQNMYTDGNGNMYTIPSQTHGFDMHGSMSAPQTPSISRQNGMSMLAGMQNYDTPPYTRNNSTATINSQNSSGASFDTPRGSFSHSQSQGTVPTTAGAASTSGNAAGGAGSASASFSNAGAESGSGSGALTSTQSAVLTQLANAGTIATPGLNGADFPFPDGLDMDGPSLFGDDDDFKMFESAGFGGDGFDGLDDDVA